MKKTKIPSTAKRIPLRPLAFGEVTGHNHRLISTGAAAVEDACELYEFEKDGETLTALRVTSEGISLIHANSASTKTADHHAHPVPPGEYFVQIQQEQTNWGTRRVLD